MHSWCATACSAGSSNVPSKKTASGKNTTRRETAYFHGPSAGRENRFAACWPRIVRRRLRGFDVPIKFARVFFGCQSDSPSTQRREMESRRQRKGLWTLAAATFSANHFNASGPARSSRQRHSDTLAGRPLKDPQTRSILSRIG
jgi:hypothetical protein